MGLDFNKIRSNLGIKTETTKPAPKSGLNFDSIRTNIGIKPTPVSAPKPVEIVEPKSTPISKVKKVFNAIFHSKDTDYELNTALIKQYRKLTYEDKNQLVFELGEGLSNKVEVLPGPRISTLEAIRRGEDVEIKTEPTKFSPSELSIAKAIISKNRGTLKLTPTEKLQSAITTLTSPQFAEAINDPDTAKLLGKSIIAQTISATMGHSKASIVNPGLGDRFLESTEQDFEELSKNNPELAGFIESLSFSLSTIAPALLSGFGTAALTKSPLIGTTVGSGVIGKMAYNMVGYNITKEYLKMKDEEMRLELGRGITAEEEKQLKDEFEINAVRNGLWEAVPEAVGGAIGFNILTKPLTAMFGRGFAIKMITKLGGVYGEELATETITELAQTQIRYDAKLPGGKQIDWSSADDWKSALVAVAPMTAAITLVTGGAVSLVTKVHSLHSELKDQKLINNFIVKIKELSQRQKSGIKESPVVKPTEPTKPTPTKLAPSTPIKPTTSEPVSLTTYHITDKENLTSIESQGLKPTPNGIYGNVTFSSTSESLSREHVKSGETIKLTVKLENPLTVSDTGKSPIEQLKETKYKTFEEWAKATNHDGVIIKNADGKGNDVILTLKPESASQKKEVPTIDFDKVRKEQNIEPVKEPIGIDAKETKKPVLVEEPTETEKDYLKMTKTEAKKDLIESKKMVADPSGRLLDKFSAWQRGIEKTFGSREELIYGGINKGVFTDGYILIEDSRVNKVYDYLIQRKIADKEKLGLKEYEDRYPDYKSIMPKGNGNKATIEGHFARENNISTVFTDGKNRVEISSDKLAFMKRFLDYDDVRITGEDKPLAFFKDNKVSGLIMPIKGDDIPTIDKKEKISDTKDIKEKEYVKHKSTTKEPESKVVSKTDEKIQGKPKLSGKPDTSDVGERTEHSSGDTDGKLGERLTTPLTEAERDELLAFSGRGGKKGAEGRGVLDEFFTPIPVVKKLWQLVNDFTKLPTSPKILEPSVGNGRVFEFAPPDAEAIGYELNEDLAKTAKKLFPGADIRNKPFEDLFVDRSGNKKDFPKDFDLVIGNPPYGIQRGFYKGVGEEPRIGRIDDYFLKRGLDVLKDGGLLVYVMPSSFLRSVGNHAKRKISETANLVVAYRLPNNIFESTGVGTDIVVFKKGKGMNKENLSNNNYFENKKENVLGQETTKRGRFGDEPFVEGTIENLDTMESTIKPVERITKAKKSFAMTTKKKEISTTKEKVDLLELFIKDLDSMSKARVIKVLNKEINWDGVIMTRKDKMLELVNNNVEIRAVEENKIKEMSRMQSFRANQQEQDAHEIKIKEAGKKTVYYVGGYNVTKIEYDYANFIKKEVVGKKTKLSGDIIKANTLEEKESIKKHIEYVDAGGRSLTEKELVIFQDVLNEFNEIPSANVYKKSIAKKYKVDAYSSELIDKMTAKEILNNYNLQELDSFFGVMEYSPNFVKQSEFSSKKVVRGKSLGELYNKSIEESITKEVEAIPEVKAPAPVVDENLLRDNLTAEEKAATYVNIDGSLASDSPFWNRSNRMDNKRYDDFNYYQGDIYKKLSQLEKDKTNLEPEQYKKQKDGLKAILPKLKKAKDISVTPSSDFVNKTVITSGGERTSLRSLFLEYLDTLSRDAFGSSSKWEIDGYVKGEQVRGTDKELNTRIRNRRREIADRLFKQFTTDALTESQLNKFEDAYNKRFNGYVRPDYKKVSSIAKFNETFKGKELKIREHQKEAIGFLTNKGTGVIAHDVGSGKTLSAILSISEVMARGWAKRPVLFVPAQVYRKWISEMNDLLPHIKINELKNLGVKVKVPEIADNTISIGTYEALSNIGLSDENSKLITDKLTDNISTGSKKSARALELEKAQGEVFSGKAARGVRAYFEDLGFDHITVDELHNFKNIFSNAKLEKGASNEYRNLRGSSSTRGVKLYYLTQYVLNNNNNRNVFGLTATPFTNSPLEIYNILSLLAKYKFEEKGLTNLNEFMNYFMKMKNTFVIKADGKLVRDDIVEEFKNLSGLQSFVKEFIDFKDSQDLDLKRPEKLRKKTQIALSEKQLELIPQAQALFADRDAGALPAIIDLQNITLTPFLSKFNHEFPTSSQLVRQSPKIRYVMEAIKAVKHKNTGQIIYMPRGIQFYDLMKEYLVDKIGYKPEQIEFIRAGVSTDQKFKISKEFNSGKLKVLIGSESMKEGIDLQERTTDLYHLHLPWNPTDLVQVEGRLWRQGNQWKRVRIHYPLIENSIDSFLFQKLETKSKRIKNIWSYRGETLDVSDINPEELKVDLITDPVRRVEAEREFQTSKLKADAEAVKIERGLAMSRLEKINELKERIEDRKKWVKEESEGNNNKSRIKTWKDDIKRSQEKLSDAKKALAKKGLNEDELQKKDKQLEAELEKLSKEVEELDSKFQRKIEDAEKIPIETRYDLEDKIPEAIKSLKEENKTFFELDDPGKNSASYASYDKFADIDIENTASQIEIPEMVKLAEQLTGLRPQLRNFPKALGKFRPTTGEVFLSPTIFEDPGQVAKILAHEIGHVTDWLPDKFIKRGTLLGRLLVIKDIRAGMLAEAKLAANLDEEITNKNLRAELLDLSEWWRPGNMYSNYRKQSSELYADFISVLFNKPEVLPSRAPLFYKEFFNFLDRKPDFKKRYFELMDTITGSSDNLLRGREIDIDKMMKDGEQLFRQKMEMAKQSKKSIWYKSKYEFFDKNIELIEKFNKLEREGAIINSEDNIKYLMEENNFIANDVKLVFDKFNKTRQEYLNNEMTDIDFGKMLFFKRVLGDRSGLANPLGHNPDTAGRQLEFMRNRLGNDKYMQLEEAVDKFQKLYKDEILTPAFESGLINPETYENIIDSDNVYGTFQTNKHILDGFVSPKIIQQVGTLDNIANPLPATLLKMVSMRRATTTNNTRKKIVDWLAKYYPEDITRVKVDHKTGYIRPAPVGFDILLTKDNGALQAYYVDEYIVKSMAWQTSDISRLINKTIGWANSRYFRPVYVTFNVGFQTFNLMRDFIRTWKSVPGATLWGVTKRYWNSIPEAKARAKGISNEIIQEMEKDKILGLTFNDMLRGAGDDITETESLLNRYDILPKEKKKIRFLNPIINFFEGIKLVGDAVETLPKVSAYKYLKQDPRFTPKDVAHFVRGRVGTPDFTRKGASADLYNNIFLFANIAKEGYRSDFETGFQDPRTRSGFWYKTVKANILPKILMMLAVLGFLGDDLKELMRKATEYDKTNYTVIPLGKDERGNAIYFRLPSDETGRFIGAITWKLLQGIRSKDIPRGLLDIISYTGGQLPSLSPVIEIPISLGQMAMGKNPVDNFRDRNVLTDDEMTAGGWYKWGPYLKWTFNKLGITRVDVRDRVKDYTVLQQVLNFVPVINRWIRVSNYGVTEELKKEQQKVEKIEAVDRLEKKEAITKYVGKWFAGDKDLDKLFSQLASSVYGGEMVTNAKITNLRKSFIEKITATKGDPNINALIYAPTVRQQIVLIKKIKENLSVTELNQIGTILQGAKIISANTWNEGIQ